MEKTNTCWIWKGAQRNTYGAFKFGDKVIDTHRVSYLLFKGDIPEGMQVCHSCDVRLCVNPDHLWLGTQSDNMQDCSNKGRLNRNPGRRFEEGNIPVNRGLSEALVLKIKHELLAGQTTIEEIAKKHKLKRSAVADISSGRTYKNITVEFN